MGFGLSALLLINSRPAMAGKVNLSKAGTAIDGHDPVAYFTQGKAVPGDAGITASHDGATYQFSSEEHKALFVADPDKFAPQYGGYCAYGAAQGYKAPVEPDKFTLLDGKLYLNYNARVQGTWIKDTAGYIEKADAFWASQ
ncbi:MAG: tat pathway signal sequence domain protein [Hoeflea sp.]|nr:tat pathway signal sequence domain protein [Alphaproteobacteria bacterium]MBV1725514.1 tat pathway signal sequence domain protein [Hoeflea sp.]MBU4546979.1 tat pathway signal sequence domain protein [Alphaproteobacteria bacterium]MBU4551509.1 tat pathway signal sequence domain protein [Alphaproteobacteria bacterium]MBV1759562.1 tat pathway signal sequence domain protein [Hoeflea sp.]